MTAALSHRWWRARNSASIRPFSPWLGLRDTIVARAGLARWRNTSWAARPICGGNDPEGRGRGARRRRLHVDGSYYALRDTCPHRGARLSGGAVVRALSAEAPVTTATTPNGRWSNARGTAGSSIWRAANRGRSAPAAGARLRGAQRVRHRARGGSFRVSGPYMPRRSRSLSRMTTSCSRRDGHRPPDAPAGNRRHRGRGVAPIGKRRCAPCHRR